MDEDVADGLWRQFKETDTAAKRGHGIGFDSSYEEQYQEALEKQYPVSSGARQVQASANAGGSLEDRFTKAADDPSAQPGYADLSAAEKIKARIKYARSEKSRAAKQTDRHWDSFVTNKKRELAGLGAIVDAQGNMLGTTYDYTAADGADLQGALASAVSTQQRLDESAHADAIFGAPKRSTPEGGERSGARRGASPDMRGARQDSARRRESSPERGRRRRDERRRPERVSHDLREGGGRRERDRREEHCEDRRGTARCSEDLRRSRDAEPREPPRHASRNQHDARRRDEVDRVSHGHRDRQQRRGDSERDRRDARIGSRARASSPAGCEEKDTGAQNGRNAAGAPSSSAAQPRVSGAAQEVADKRTVQGPGSCTAGGVAAADGAEAARVPPSAEQLAWREALAAVPEGATVVMEAGVAEAGSGAADASALQEVGLDSSFAAAAGGSWRDRMRKKATE